MTDLMYMGGYAAFVWSAYAFFFFLYNYALCLQFYEVEE